jgi:hypothetical protein
MGMTLSEALIVAGVGGVITLCTGAALERYRRRLDRRDNQTPAQRMVSRMQRTVRLSAYASAIAGAYVANELAREERYGVGWLAYVAALALLGFLIGLGLGVAAAFARETPRNRDSS